MRGLFVRAENEKQEPVSPLSLRQQAAAPTPHPRPPLPSGPGLSSLQRGTRGLWGAVREPSFSAR